ncbi:hypothetical protein [Spirochaeta africana]|uniref:Uncharacterized protein n=1 Tax=Spirochaeta africana (strain ATCC 700263 / DSM 8902 / Z-7692) TaxID=889378 RepID=H9UFG0_SPIAZ|nr:hypothetical protein [Spirochaeta africana]AFG36253.1 hypothetical protein Spiaf_0144 [Spirochaeta africana DSM 8902]
MVFTTAVWRGIVMALSYSFRLSEQEQRQLYEHRFSRLLAFTPFFAECDQPMFTAIDHISSNMVASRGAESLSDHSEEDNTYPEHRIQRLFTHSGGDSQILKRHRALVTLFLAAGYHRDREYDDRVGIYNPFNAGVWNWQDLHDHYYGILQSIPCPEMDEIFSYADVNDPSSYWTETRSMVPQSRT